jgi:hypothetical protein
MSEHTDGAVEPSGSASDPRTDRIAELTKIIWARFHPRFTGGTTPTEQDFQRRYEAWLGGRPNSDPFIQQARLAADDIAAGIDSGKFVLRDE